MPKELLGQRRQIYYRLDLQTVWRMRMLGRYLPVISGPSCIKQINPWHVQGFSRFLAGFVLLNFSKAVSCFWEQLENTACSSLHQGKNKPPERQINDGAVLTRNSLRSSVTASISVSGRTAKRQICSEKIPAYGERCLLNPYNGTAVQNHSVHREGCAALLRGTPGTHVRINTKLNVILCLILYLGDHPAAFTSGEKKRPD